MSSPTASDQDKAQAIAVVSEFLQVFVKGLRAVQLYLPNNPVRLRALENLQAALGNVWGETAELRLQVGETDLTWEGNGVLEQPNKAESIAWVLYKDGVRVLTLVPGAEDEELVRLLQVIHRTRSLGAESDDDLLTLLWEQDFQTIRYDYVQLGLDEVPPLEASDEEPHAKPEDVRQEVEQAREEEEQKRPAGLVNIDDFDSTLYFLDESEIRYLKDEIEREYSQDLRGNVLAMLFDLLELQSYTTVRAELSSILEHFIPYLLAVGDFQSVAYVLREVKVVISRARELQPEHHEALLGLSGKLSEPDSLGQLLQSLDEALVHPTEEELGELFRELRPEALESLFAWLPRLTNERVRSLLDAAARRLAQAHPDQLVKALGTDDEAGLLNAIRVASQLGLPPLIPALGRLLERPEVGVRRAAVDALTAVGSAGAMQQLERALVDRDREVRVNAVRALGVKGHRNALPKVDAAIKGKELRAADLTEKTAFFEAYGRLAGGAGLQALGEMLEVKGLMRRKEDPEIRACAAMALGKIGTPEARRALEGAKSDKDALVRNAVNKALREMTS